MVGSELTKSLRFKYSKIRGCLDASFVSPLPRSGSDWAVEMLQKMPLYLGHLKIDWGKSGEPKHGTRNCTIGHVPALAGGVTIDEEKDLRNLLHL